MPAQHQPNYSSATRAHAELAAFCAAHNMKYATFGRKLGDPPIIADVFQGRTIGQSLERRIRAVMAAIAAGETLSAPTPKFKRVTPAVQTKRTYGGERGGDMSPDNIQHLIVRRDPCFKCGVRRDVHDELGCRRWRAGE